MLTFNSQIYLLLKLMHPIQDLEKSSPNLIWTSQRRLKKTLMKCHQNVFPEGNWKRAEFLEKVISRNKLSTYSILHIFDFTETKQIYHAIYLNLRHILQNISLINVCNHFFCFFLILILYGGGNISFHTVFPVYIWETFLFSFLKLLCVI